MRPLAARQPGPRTQTDRARSGGQIVVMFAVASVLFTLLCGVVVDLAYYWVGSLQAQRAADAAALAGAVYLPGDTTTAYSTARASATENGFTVGGAVLTVTPVQDTTDPRQLDVTITARVGTFFSRVAGIAAWPVTVTSKAVYVLPVPMGSPDAYYGVGNYSVNRTTGGTTTMVTTNGVSDGPTQSPPSGTFLTSRGAWGAVITKGGDQSNGDAYSPTSSSKTTNAYNADGYDYVAKLPAGGTLRVFDPGFCAMGGNGAGGSMGAGDHWIGTSGTPVSTYYTVWNTNGKPGLRAAWTEVYTSGILFQGQKGFDPANTAPNVASGAGPSGATSGCDAYHNAWWTMPTGSLIAGTYAVQVQTTRTAHTGVSADSTQNQSTNAENMFALEAVGGADGSGNSPQIYGNGKMVVYNNLLGGTPPPVQKFYLAQIDRSTGAGKTALIDLWDIGDISGTGTLRILSPDGGSQNYVNFTYTTDASCTPVTGAMGCYNSGTASPSVSSIVTTVSGAQATNGTWIHIRVTLPSTYGTTLWNNGWWQVEYTVTQGGNDTTTWQVSVSGNPVHLLVP